MFRDLLRRGVECLLIVILASFVAFLVLRVVPGDPARLIDGPLASQDTLAETRQSLGLDDPLHSQYTSFLSDFLHGDWGYSFSIGQDVRPALTTRLAATLEVSVFAFILAVVGAIACATVASYRKGLLRGLVRFFALIGLGSPPFWVGLVLVVVFSSKLGLFPGPSGRITAGLALPPDITGFYTVDYLLGGDFVGLSDAAAHLLLPAVALALLPWAFLTRLLTANMMNTAEEPFVLVVRSKGVSAWRTHQRHVLANSLLPTVSSAGLIFAALITGSVLVETVFDWPGVGGLLTTAISNQDFAVVQSFTLLAAIIYVTANLVGDAVNRVLDPRLRTHGGAR